MTANWNNLSEMDVYCGESGWTWAAYEMDGTLIACGRRGYHTAREARSAARRAAGKHGADGRY